MAAHYGCLIDPARAAKPRDKPRVERPMPYVRDSFWRGRDVGRVERHADRRGRRGARRSPGAAAHRSLDGAQPLAVFDAVEAAGAAGAAARAVRAGAAGRRRRSRPDCHVKVGRALYSVPWRLIGRRVDARAGRPYRRGVRRRRSWSRPGRIERGRQTDYGDYPPEKIAFFMRTPAWCRRRAGELGAARRRAGRRAAGRSRAAPPARRPGRHRSGRPVTAPTRLDAACRRAIEVGDPSYRTVKGILAAGTEQRPADRRQRRAGVDARRTCTAREPRLFHPDATVATATVGDDGGAMTRRHQLETTLRTLKLSGMLDTLDARLAQARAGELGHLEFLQVLCEDEIARRDAAAVIRRVRQARFEHAATLEDFDFAYNPDDPRRRHPRPRHPALRRRRRVGHPPRPRRGRQDHHRPGPRPPGLPPRPHRRVHQDQPTARRPRRRPRRPHLGAPGCAAGPDPTLLILDDFAMRDFTAAQADDLYELITERAGRPLVLTSNRPPTDWYPLFPNPVVAESILDRLINTAHHVHMDGRSYRPNKRPGRPPTEKGAASD